MGCQLTEMSAYEEFTVLGHSSGQYESVDWPHGMESESYAHDYIFVTIGLVGLYAQYVLIKEPSRTSPLRGEEYIQELLRSNHRRIVGNPSIQLLLNKLSSIISAKIAEKLKGHLHQAVTSHILAHSIDKCVKPQHARTLPTLGRNNLEILLQICCEH